MSADDVIVEEFKIKRMRAAADLFIETLMNYKCIEDRDVFLILEEEANKLGYRVYHDGVSNTFIPDRRVK